MQILKLVVSSEKSYVVHFLIEYELPLVALAI